MHLSGGSAVRGRAPSNREHVLGVQRRSRTLGKKEDGPRTQPVPPSIRSCNEVLGLRCAHRHVDRHQQGRARFKDEGAENHRVGIAGAPGGMHHVVLVENLVARF
jgi:hypothetical protein